MDIQNIRLKNGVEMPIIGFGTYFPNIEDTTESVLNALNSGYRMLDMAKWYQNEKLVAKAIKESKVKRKDIFITYKVEPKSYKEIIDDVFEAMNTLDTTYLDLVLLHWPYNNIRTCYQALEDLYNAGIVRAIGVSNFDEVLLEDLYNNVRFKPLLNQVETHIYFQEKKMNKYLTSKEIVHESWAPFAEGYLDMLDDENLKIIAKRYKKSVAQIILRFFIQKNIIVIPKSTNKKHIQENIDVFDFELKEEDIKKIELLDRKTQYSNWPQNMKIETFY